MIYFVAMFLIICGTTFASDNCRGKFALVVDHDHSNQARALAHKIEMPLVKEHLEVLTGKQPLFYHHKLNDRHTSTSRELARIYLINVLQKLGLVVKIEKFERGVNFYAEVPGLSRDAEVFEVAAHYDTQAANNPGADDNGSGVAILLEMARIFSIHRPERRLRLTFLDLEEDGSIGANVHADLLTKEFGFLGPREDQERTFMGTLIVDMVGYSPSSEHLEKKLLIEVGKQKHFEESYAAYGDRAASAKWSRNAAYEYNLACAAVACDQFLRFASGRKRVGNLSLSIAQGSAMPKTGDHGSYWQRGIPAMFLGTPYDEPYINPGNHSSGDTIEKINWRFFQSAAELAVEITAALTKTTLDVDSPALAKAVREVNPESATFEGEGADNVELLTVKTPKPSVVSPFASSSYVSSEPPSNIGIDFRLTKVLNVLKDAESAETLSLVLESNAVRGDVFYIENGRVSSLFITDLETLKTVLRLMRDRLRPLYLRESSGSNFRFEEFARAVHKAVLGEAIHPDKIDGNAVKKISYFELPYALGPDPVVKKAVKRTKKPKDGRRPKKAPASEKAALMPPIPEAAKSQDSSAINVENLDGFFRNNWKVREVVGVLKNPKSAETLSILLESDAKKGHVFYLLSNEIRSFYIDDFGILKVVLGLMGAQSRPLFRTAEDGVHSQIDEFARAVQKAMLGKAEYPVKIEDKHVKKIPYTELPYILVPVKWTP